MNKEYSEIGLIIDVSGTYDENGDELSPPTYFEGWHVNMTELLPELAEFEVFPENPRRVYADAPTTFLKFADEAEWRGIVESWVE